MKEHQDDVLLSAKKSSPSVDLTTADENVSERGKIKGFSGEKDEGEDMMVDVVGADVVVDDHGCSRVHLEGKVSLNGSVEEGSERKTEARDQVMEDVGVVEVVSDAVVGSKDLTLEKVEVVVSEEGVKRSVEVSKTVVRENIVTTIASGSDFDAQKSGNESVMGNSKMDSEQSREALESGVTKEILEQSTESVQEVPGGDHVMNEKTEKEIPESSTITANLGSPKGHVVAEEEGLVGKDKSEDGVTNQSLSTDVVDAGKGEDNVHVTTKNLDQQTGVDQPSTESLQSTIEVTATGVQKSGNGTHVGDSKTAAESLSGEHQLVEGETVTQKEESERGLTKEMLKQPMESVQDGGKDEAKDAVSKDSSSECPDNPSFSSDGINAGTDVGAVHENAGKEAQSHSTLEVRKDDAQKSGIGTGVGDSKIDGESTSKDRQVIEGNDKEVGPERSLTEEIVKSPLDSVQEVADGDRVMNEKTAKEDEPMTRHSLHSEEVDVVVVEGLEGKDKAQDDFSVKPNVVCPDNQSLTTEAVNAETGDGAAQVDTESLDQKAEVDPTSKDESSHATIEFMITDASQKISKVSDLGSTQHLSVKDEVLMMVNKGQVSSENMDVAEVDGSRFQVLDETSKVEGDVEIDAGVETSKVEPQTIGDTSNFDDQGLKGDAVNNSISASPSNDQFLLNSGIEITAGIPCTDEMRGSEISVQCFGAVNDATTQADYAEQAVLPEGSEFSYEAAHMERGEDAGVDIDEVLGWKDEIPGIVASGVGVVCPEKDQNANAEADVEQQEDLKTQQPIVYERRLHVEAPVPDALDKSSSARVKDESLKVETQCENSVEVKVETAQLSSVDEKINEYVNEHNDTREHTDFCRNQETEALDHTMEAEQSTCTDDTTESLDDETSVLLQQSCYFHSPENEGAFSVSDLVWGKVRSHPWWPGQIFDPSDASEKAMKYHKKDCFLVAYFGDRTFAWNDSSVLKPFRAKFSQIEKHSISEAFNNAVCCALEEVSRRVELGLTCSCVSQDIYEKIKCQVVENAGIRQESSRRHGIDKSASVGSFEPDKLLEYVKLLAKFPYEGDKMELVMAKAQLSSYVRYKGYRQLPELQFCGNLLEDSSMLGEGVEQVIKDGQQISIKKESSLTELTVDATYAGDEAERVDGNVTGDLVSSPGSKKRKALESISDGSEKRPSLHTETVSPTAKPSFKVGECIQRVASQLTGPPSVLKNAEPNDQPVGVAGSVQSPGAAQQGRLSDQGYPSDMLSQLHLAAQDPMKGYSFLNTIIPFFHSHRASVLSKSRKTSSAGRPTDPRKRKMSNENDPEEFEFDDVNDSYWTDRVIQNYPEEQPLQDNQNGGGENQVLPYEQDKPVKPSRRSNKKRFFSSNHEIEAKEQSELIERRRLNLATEVLMKFAEGVYFPSEIHLNKMFKRFGPLMESETEVDRQSGRARVVFKKCSDAEVAHSSAGKFNIFGSISVNYELNYTPLISYRPLPLLLAQDPADAC